MWPRPDGGCWPGVVVVSIDGEEEKEETGNEEEGEISDSALLLP